MENERGKGRTAAVRRGWGDFGYLPSVFGALFGTPSIISLTQSTFALGDLHGPVREIVGAYDDGLRFVGGLIEPALRPVLDGVGALFGWDLALLPHWRHLFVLCMVFVLASARTRLQEGGSRRSLADLVPTTLGALAGSAAAGTIPLDGAWWAQGLIAALPLSLTWLGMTAGNLFGFEIGRIMKGLPPDASWSFRLGYVPLAVILGVGRALGQMLIVVPPYFVIGFVLGATFSFVPGLGAGGGIAALAAFAIAVGAYFLRRGLTQGDTYGTRLGLTILGGFAAAGAVLALDMLLRP